MIVKMQKLYIAVRTQDQEQLLEALRDLAVLHLSPVDPAKAVPDEKILKAIDELERARQILGGFTPQGTCPDLSAEQAAADAIHLHRETVEISSRLNTIHQRMEQLSLWGEVRLEQLEELRKKGLFIDFYTLPQEKLPEIQADCIHVLRHYPGNQVLAALANRGSAITVPKEVIKLDWPHEDRPKLRSVAKRLDENLKRDNQRLAELAHLVPRMDTRLIELHNEAGFSTACRGAFQEQKITALQGWLPKEKGPSLASDLAARGIQAAVLDQEPTPDEEPPTLIRYWSWVKPIQGLFDILGTLPGYHELDLSPFFMLAFPLVSAILIGDAGYGMLFMLAVMLFYRRLTVSMGKPKTWLLFIMGLETFLWGMMSANYFGITPDVVARIGGFVTGDPGSQTPDVALMQQAHGGWASLGNAMIAVAPLWNIDSEKVRELLIQISFLIGCIHLTLAHLSRGVAMLPDLRALAEFGWCLFLWAMLGVIWLLFFGMERLPVNFFWIQAAFALGGALVVLFTSQSRNPFKRVGVGIVANILPAMGTFSDTMSYIRLMAVGLASGYISAAFNGLGASAADAFTWFAGAPIVLFGHLLNIGLAIIAVFAHGVRLNMLEFSCNAGVQWAGYAYDPFRKKQ